MSDRQFPDCCYGTDWQHGPSDPCPWIVHATYILDTGMVVAGPKAVARYLMEHFVPVGLLDGSAAPTEPRAPRTPLAEPEDGCWYGIERCTMPYCDCNARSAAEMGDTPAAPIPGRVQIQNPVTKEWVKLDTETGRIVGSKKSPYQNVPKKQALSDAQRAVLMSLRPAGFGQHMGPERPNCLASCEAMRRRGLVENAEDRRGADAFVNGTRLFVRLTARGLAVHRSLVGSDQ